MLDGNHRKLEMKSRLDSLNVPASLRCKLELTFYRIIQIGILFKFSLDLVMIDEDLW